jgi:16S rRNA (cytosine1402-N4)-methyltransferase
VILKQNIKMLINHQPVLLEEVLRYLAPQPGEKYLDLTAGYGGHAKSVLDKIGSLDNMTLVDRDAKAVDQLRIKFGDQAKILQQDFLTSARQLLEQGQRFDCILADLGVSSPHLDNASRCKPWVQPQSGRSAGYEDGPVTTN